jgi:predicted DNA-binding transcriptional regulator YafY
MDRTERFYKIEMMIRARSAVSFDDLLAGVEVSRATLKRDLQYLRSRMDAPIVYDRFENGYKLQADPRDERQVNHQLPGVWFSEREIHALLTMHQLIAGLDNGCYQRKRLGLDEAQDPTAVVLEQIKSRAQGGRCHSDESRSSPPSRCTCLG